MAFGFIKTLLLPFVWLLRFFGANFKNLFAEIDKENNRNKEIAKIRRASKRQMRFNDEI